MAFKATKAQAEAINAQGCVLVSAAAGSGKTAVLVERVVKMLTNHNDPVFADRMLIVTFTNAAAAEMLSRIETRLYQELEKDTNDELIKRQCYLIKSADICTIDSFCIRLVRENFALCGIEPDFKVTDDSSLSAVRKQVLIDIIGEQIDAGSKEIDDLFELTSCKFGEGPLAELIDKIYISAKKTPSVKEFIDSLRQPYNACFDKEHIWYKYAFSLAGEKIAQIKKKVERFAEAALFCENTDKAVSYSESVSSIVYTVAQAADTYDWDVVFETVRSAKIGNLPNKSTDEMKSLKEQIKGDIDSISALFSEPLSELRANHNRISPSVNLLCDMASAYYERMFERLKEENTFSFDDVEQLAFGLLCNNDENGQLVKSEYANTLIARYDRVLVDEFQDVNDLQDMLFDILSDNGKNLFVVGDVKQSIYAFRGSNPDIFLSRKNTYTDYSEANRDEKKKILLSDNFRSREGICSSVNFFFKSLMSEQVGKLVYGEDEKLNYGAKDYIENGQTDTDLIVIDKVDDKSGDSLIKSEAIAIADYISRTLEKDKILKGKDGVLREADYGDFCILLAALKDKSGVIAEELNSRGIPAKVSDGEFFTSTEIVTLLALMHIIDNPKNDVYLLRVLMSPLFGFTAEDMANIRIGRQEMSLFSAVNAYAENSEKAGKFCAQISDLRRASCMLTLDRFISYVIDKTDMINLFYSLPDGEIRAQNIMYFMKLASDYDSGSSGSIYGFLKHMESLPEDAVKPSVTADDNCVKIMSVHRSKGLQFPICIVAGLSSKINTSDALSACIYSKEYGIGFKYFSRDILDKYENIGHKVLNAESRKNIARERLRLLYVAMTRAEEKLCLVCSLKNARRGLFRAAQASNFGSDAISGEYILSASASSDYILAAAIIHPDADVLRRISECKVSTADANGNINVSFVDASKTAETECRNSDTADPDFALAERLNDNIGYIYPLSELSGIPSKISVSTLANKTENEHFAMTDRPSFMEKGGLGAAGRGTAIHKIMQYIEFGELPNVDREIKRLVRDKRITSVEAAAADREKIKEFFNSDLYSRICNSDTVKREMRFLTETPVSFLSKNPIGKDDTFIIQGAVDLCFVENDEVVVVDFKTDYVKNGTELSDRYSDQLSIYAMACKKIFGKPVKEKIIYSFHLSEQINI
ncbi:MAG: helicase-exonuclease AddAB subunit AddA [Clostridia bacterium]|nr:helicase-exonuclease AddAB subunit AddA [Clostridia bacterium]